MNFFYKQSKSKKKLCVCVGGRTGEGACVCVGGVCGRIDGRTDEQAQTNLPLQLLRSWGHNDALMDKLCKLCA